MINAARNEPLAYRKVSIPLIIGIVVVPLVFAWFLLRNGYSPLARRLGFGWLALAAMIALFAPAPPNLASRIDSSSIKSPQVKELRKDGFFAAVIDRRSNGVHLPQFARDLCGSRPFCNVTGWIDKGRIARGYPFTDREAEAIAFSYSVNRRNGSELIYWDCRIWPQADASNCIE